MTTVDSEIRDCWLLDPDQRCPNMVCCQLCPLSPNYWRNAKPPEPEPAPVTGVLSISHRSGTVGVVVADGRVVDYPPYARRMVEAAGGSARKLLDQQTAKGAVCKWIPDRKDTT